MNSYTYSKTEDLAILKLEHDGDGIMAQQHYHDTFEVLFVTEGERYMFFNNVMEKVSEGDLVIFLPYVLHASRQSEGKDYRRYRINFNINALMPVLSEAEAEQLLKELHTSVIHVSGEGVISLIKYLDRLRELQTKDDMLSKKLTSIGMVTLIMALCNLMKDSQHSFKRDIVCSDRFADILNYINSNYTRHITLDDAVEYAHMSKTHFCRLFKNETGLTFLKHINNLRLARAHYLLVHTDHSIRQIAEMAGFSSLLQFERIFKSANGKSPQALRRSLAASD